MALRDANAFNKLGGLSPDENKFVNTSIAWRDEQERQKKNRRRNTILSLSGFSVIALALSIWGFTSSIAAKNNEKIAQYRLGNACGYIYRVGAQPPELYRYHWGVTEEGYKHIKSKYDKNYKEGICQHIIDIDPKDLDNNRDLPSWGPGSRNYKWD